LVRPHHAQKAHCPSIFSAFHQLPGAFEPLLKSAMSTLTHLNQWHPAAIGTFVVKLLQLSGCSEVRTGAPLSGGAGFQVGMEVTAAT